MKKLITFFFCTLSVSLFSQNNWALFPENQVSWWRLGNDLVLHYNDSTEIEGGISIHYFGKKYIEAQFGDCFEETDSIIQMYELDDQEGSLRKAETLFSTPDYWFWLDENGDTLKFFHQSNIGESWSLSVNTSSVDFFQLSCSGIFEEEILDFTDSVKVFDIQAFKNGNPVEHAYNDFEILLAKNVGLVNFFPFSSLGESAQDFELVGFDNGEPHGFLNSFWDYFGHFNIGDVFLTYDHWQVGIMPTDRGKKFTWDSITQVEFSAEYAKIYYDRRGIIHDYEIVNDPPYYQLVFDTFEVLNLERTYWKEYYDSLFQRATQHWNAPKFAPWDNFVYHSPYFEGDNPIEKLHNSPLVFDDPESCELFYIFDYFTTHQWFKPNLGFYKAITHGGFSGDDFDTTMVICAKKNGVWIGENCLPTLTPIFEVEHSNLDFKIYPNPISDFINIELPPTQFPIQLSIFDTTGKMILEENLVHQNSEINVSHFQKGIYFLQVFDDNSFGRKRFIKF